MSFTLDANVLLYASDESSPVHAAALAAVQQLADGPEIAYLFWPTVMAYLRISTHPAIEQLLARSHVRTTGEGETFWRSFQAVSDDAMPAGNLVPDAHLVTLMLEHDVRTLWTRDRDFRRFPRIEVRDPFA